MVINVVIPFTLTVGLQPDLKHWSLSFWLKKAIIICVQLLFPIHQLCSLIKVFNNVHLESLWHIFGPYGMPQEIVVIINRFYNYFTCRSGSSKKQFQRDDRRETRLLYVGVVLQPDHRLGDATDNGRPIIRHLMDPLLTPQKPGFC